MVLVVGKRTTTTKRGANQRGLWIQLTHEFSEVKGQLAHHQEQTKKTTGLSGALKGPKKRGRAKKKIRTKNPQTFWLKTAIIKKKNKKNVKKMIYFKSNQIKSNQIKTNQIKPKQILKKSITRQRNPKRK